jgi:predicted ATPase
MNFFTNTTHQTSVVTMSNDGDSNVPVTVEHTLTEAERNLASPGEVPLYKFVFTGGPCGGKTTALARVFLYLRERGFEVITCPEAFTILATNGMNMDFFTTEGMGKIIQGTVLDVQMSIEDSVERVLRARGKPAVILCDRGSMDGSVYVTKAEFQQVMAERNTNMVQLRDNRYNAVFHLVSAADGAEAHYTLANNKARTESPEEARQADKNTQKAWVGHPHLYVLDNTSDFEAKMSRLIDVVSKVVGLPSNLKRRSAKFLLKGQPNVASFPAEINYQMFEVEKAYLQQSDEESENYSFVRRRTNIDESGKLLGSVYQLTTAKLSDDELIEQKRIITQREYSAAYMTRDTNRHVVRQRRISFLYNLQSFVVHVYEQPVADLCILHAQVEAAEVGKEPEVDLPPFLNVERRLTNTKPDEHKYGAYSLSLIREE